MKKIVFIFISLLLLFLCSCNENLSYTFMQSFENITSIDIIYIDGYSNYRSYDHLEAVYTIPPEQWEPFIDGLNRMTCKKQSYEPSYSLQGNVIRIIYKDSSYEVISQHTGAQFFINDYQKYPHIRFDKEEFNEFINRTLLIRQGT